MNKEHAGQGRLLFATNFLKHPSMLGSVIPSSRQLVERVLDPVDWSRAERLVEFGPGVGTLTAEILDRLGPDGRLLVVELNPDFVEHLRRRFNDPRLEVVHDSAAELDRLLEERGWNGVDYIISGIPLSTLPQSARDSILQQARASLRPAGALLIYQFSNRVRSDLERLFPQVESGFVLRNFLPARYYHCRAAGG